MCKCLTFQTHLLLDLHFPLNGVSGHTAYVSRLTWVFAGHVEDIEDLYMSAHVLLDLLNEFGKSDKCEACQAFHRFFATSLRN